MTEGSMKDPCPDLPHPPGRCEDCDRYRAARISYEWRRKYERAGR